MPESNAEFTLVPSIRSKYWEALPIGGKVRVAGTATSYSRESSKYGPYSVFVGQFVAAVENGRSVSSVKMMLPKFGDDVVRANLDSALSNGAAAVEFAIELEKVEDKSSVTGYVWELRSLQEPIVPTERFHQLVDFSKTPALSHKGKGEDKPAPKGKGEKA